MKRAKYDFQELKISFFVVTVDFAICMDPIGGLSP